MTDSSPTDFIRTQVAEQLAAGKYSHVQTRFPPEPNGYLHIGHAFAINLDFTIADENDGQCNLRFDDTNPVKEEQAFVDGIIFDINWLGFEPDNVFYASDYFGQLYDWAIKLIEQGDAYVDDLTQEEMRDYRGTLTEPGRNSPYRDRSIMENLDLFERMKNGEFAEGTHTLRAKIDMASPNINLRDPVMYRILKVHHQRTENKWCIYPMYDWAHGQSDSIEKVTHSFCSLEYVIHRPLYNWFVEKLGIFAPTQIEFARISLRNTIMSKRNLKKLVDEGMVAGWDDPRMPTLAGMRRRGYTPESIRDFCNSITPSSSNHEMMIEYQQLEYYVRNHLNAVTPRAMAVLDPLKVVVTNYPEGQIEMVELPNYPQDRSRTESRQVPFGRELYIEREDFAEVPPNRWKRMSPGYEIRLLGAYFVTTQDVIKDADGNVTEIHVTLDPETQGGAAPDKRRPKGTIHWVEATTAIPATVNLYDMLFSAELPGDRTGDFMDDVNPDSLTTQSVLVEPALAKTSVGDKFQFMRNAYFTVDATDPLTFNRIVTLRDSFKPK